MGIVSPVWGPFTDPLDAAGHLGRFADEVVGPGFGIAWIAQDKLYAIRKPTYDANGFGEVITFEFKGIPAPSAPPAPTGTGVLAWLGHMWDVGSKAVVGEVRAAGSTIENGFARVWHNAFDTKEHRMDGVGVALDALGIGISVVLMSFGPLEVLGAVALIGGAALLVMDGASYVSECAGNEETANNIKRATFYPRCLATLATLPDAIWGVGRVVLDSAEIATKVSRSLATADRAAADASRVTAAARGVESARATSLAQRYAEIGAAAQKRAQAAQRRLSIFVSCQAAGRAAIPPGIYLLTKEATEDKSRLSEIQRILRQYVFHVSAVHRA